MFAHPNSLIFDLEIVWSCFLFDLLWKYVKIPWAQISYSCYVNLQIERSGLHRVVVTKVSRLGEIVHDLCLVRGVGLHSFRKYGNHLVCPWRPRLVGTCLPSHPFGHEDFVWAELGPASGFFAPATVASDGRLVIMRLLDVSVSDFVGALLWSMEQFVFRSSGWCIGFTALCPGNPWVSWKTWDSQASMAHRRTGTLFREPWL